MKSSRDATRNLTNNVFRYWDDDIKQMSPSPRFNPNQTPCGQTRREFLWQAGGGFAGLGLIDLFGHTPTSEGVNKPGRDHNWHGFSMWLAGAGVKGDQAIGATAGFGFGAVEDKTHVSDLHATILHLMGLDHNKLTYFHQGLDQKLTGVQRVAKVVKKSLA